MADRLSLAGKRVLITGANGFIGARLAERLVREGASVTALVSPASTCANLTALSGAATVTRADICDRASVQAVVASAAPQIVYHLASYGNHPQHYSAPASDVLARITEINVMGTANLLAACRATDLACFVQAGSAAAEYGAGSLPMHEQQRLAPSTYYGASKAASTLLVSAFGMAEGKNVVTLRPLYVYGPGDWPFRFIPSVIAAGLHGRTLSLTSLAEQKNFVFIDDVVEAFWLAARRYDDVAPVINIGAGRESTLGDVIRAVEAQLGRPVSYKEGSYGKLQWPRDCWDADIGLAERLLDWRPTISLDEGIRRTIEWMRGDGGVR